VWNGISHDCKIFWIQLQTVRVNITFTNFSCCVLSVLTDEWIRLTLKHTAMLICHINPGCTMLCWFLAEGEGDDRVSVVVHQQWHRGVPQPAVRRVPPPARAVPRRQHAPSGDLDTLLLPLEPTHEATGRVVTLVRFYMPKFEKLAQRAVCECYALWSGKKKNLVVRATVLKNFR